jgi:hypothetical protein
MLSSFCFTKVYKNLLTIQELFKKLTQYLNSAMESTIIQLTLLFAKLTLVALKDLKVRGVMV